MKKLQLALILLVVTSLFLLFLEPLKLAQEQHTTSISTIMTISSVNNANINASPNIQTIQNKTVNYYNNASG